MIVSAMTARTEKQIHIVKKSNLCKFIYHYNNSSRLEEAARTRAIPSTKPCGLHRFSKLIFIYKRQSTHFVSMHAASIY